MSKLGYYFGFSSQDSDIDTNVCTSSATNLLDELEIMPELTWLWERNFIVPFKLIRNLKDKSLPENTSIFGDYFKTASSEPYDITIAALTWESWASDPSDGVEAGIMDPELIYSSLFAMTQTAVKLNGGKARGRDPFRENLFNIGVAKHLRKQDKLAKDAAKELMSKVPKDSYLIKELIRTKGVIFLLDDEEEE